MMSDQKDIYVGIGSNIEREKNISGGLVELKNCFGELVVSSIYESKAFGFSGNNFFNLVAGFVTDLPVSTLTERLREIEYRFGRERNQEKYSSRTLDIDVLLYGDLVCDDGHLVLPREDIEKYSFVLRPLAEIAGTEVHPVNGKSYAQLWQEFTGNRNDLWRLDFDPFKHHTN